MSNNNTQSPCPCRKCYLGQLGRLGTILIRTLVDSVGDDRPCSNTAGITIGRNELLAANNYWDGIDKIMSAIVSPYPPTPIHIPRTPIPIRVRLEIHHTNSRQATPLVDGVPSFEAIPCNKKLTTQWEPSPLSSDTPKSGTHTTISDITKYIVEDLFMKNSEKSFLYHYPSNFLEILLGRGRGSSLPHVVFDYGVKMKMSNTATGSAPGTRIIFFSLIEEETEGYPIVISPHSNAYSLLRKFLPRRSGIKKLDLILKAHVMDQKDTKMPPRKRKSLLKDVERSDDNLNAKRNRKGVAIETIPPEATSQHPNGIPQTLGKAWDGHQVSLANEERKADSETEMIVEQLPATSIDVEYDGDDDEGMNVDSDTEGRKSDKENLNIADDVVSSAKIDSNEKMAADDSISVSSSGRDKNIEGEAEEIRDRVSMMKSKDKSSPDEKSASLLSIQDFEEHGEDEELDAGNKDASNVVPIKNGESSVASSNAPANERNAGHKGNIKSTTRKGALKRSSSSELGEDSFSKPSSSGEESEDKNKKSLDTQALTVSFTEPGKDERETTASTQYTEEKGAGPLAPPTLVKSTPYDVTAASSDPVFTQESALVPTVLFEESGYNNAATRHMRGSQIESSTTRSIDRAEKSEGDSPESEGDSVSSSSSPSSDSGGSEGSSSGDEDFDGEKSNEKNETKSDFEQSATYNQAVVNEATHWCPLAHRSNSPASKCGSSSGTNFGAKGEEVKKENIAGGMRAGCDRESSSSSSSSGSRDSSYSSDSSSSSDRSSSSDSSPGSDDSSSDSDSDSSSSDEEEESNEMETKTKSFLPVVRRSRGRRRTPLVSMRRKIIINTSTTKPVDKYIFIDVSMDGCFAHSGA